MYLFYFIHINQQIFFFFFNCQTLFEEQQQNKQNKLINIINLSLTFYSTKTRRKVR